MVLKVNGNDMKRKLFFIETLDLKQRRNLIVLQNMLKNKKFNSINDKLINHFY